MNYSRPSVMVNETLAEGVYAASGSVPEGPAGNATCYETTAYIHQTPELGRETYVLQVNSKHVDSHTCSKQQLVLNFSAPVEYVSSNGTYVSGNGSNTITIDYSYWNNPSDNIGLGDVSVKTSAASLTVTGATLYHIAD